MGKMLKIQDYYMTRESRGDFIFYAVYSQPPYLGEQGKIKEFNSIHEAEELIEKLSKRENKDETRY